MKNKGFTLVELVIVIAIVGVLAVLIISYINPPAQLQRARDTQRKSDLAQIQRALEQYYNDFGSYPLSKSDDGSYIIKDSTGATHAWNTPWTPYINTLPIDPTSTQKYVYVSNGATFYLYAHLERTDDKQYCNTDATTRCLNAPADTTCGGAGDVCNYGVSSQNVTP
ncbi:MAG TPA: type II secretion system protein [Patescibacteria group bacterium]|nr:type II secretion system protein [Patescibacteria group bacterium]